MTFLFAFLVILISLYINNSVKIKDKLFGVHANEYYLSTFNKRKPIQNFTMIPIEIEYQVLKETIDNKKEQNFKSIKPDKISFRNILFFKRSYKRYEVESKKNERNFERRMKFL